MGKRKDSESNRNKPPVGVTPGKVVELLDEQRAKAKKFGRLQVGLWIGAVVFSAIAWGWYALLVAILAFGVVRLLGMVYSYVTTKKIMRQTDMTIQDLEYWREIREITRNEDDV